MDYFKKICFKWWGMLLLSAIPFFIFLVPLLFNGEVFLGSDLINWSYPAYHFYQDSIDNSNSIFWNPNNFSGFPSFIGSMGFLSPFNYIFFKFLSLFTAYNLIIFLNTTFGLFFTWLFLKKINLSFWSGYVGGLVYVFSQWSHITDISISNALPVLPLLFLIIWQISKKSNYWFVVLGALIVGYGWLSIHFNWFIMILSASFLLVIFLSLSHSKKLIFLFRIFLIIFLGTLIGLFVIYPLLVYGDLSARAEGLLYKETTTGAINIADFLRYLLPNFKLSFLNLSASPAQIYLGVLPLFFLFFALKLKKPLINFFIFLFFTCILIGVKYSPLFWIIHQFPVFNSFRGPHRWMFICSFTAAVLASFGVNYFFAKGMDRWKELLLKIFKWISWFILGISIISTLVFYVFKDKLIYLIQDYFDKNIYSKTSGLPIEHYHRVIDGIFTEISQLFNILNPNVFLPIVFIFISYFVISYFNKNKEKNKYFFQMVVLVIFLNFLSVFIFYHQSISSRYFNQQPETVSFLKEQIQQQEVIESGRIFSFLPGFSEYIKLTIPYQSDINKSFIFQSEIIAPNINILYGIESVDYYDNLMSRPMSRVLALIGSDRATTGDKLSDSNITIEQKVKKLSERKKILDFLGVRYIISVFPLDKEIFLEVFRANIPPYNIPVSIYENKQARSLFYLADKVKTIKPSEEKAYQKLLEESLEGKNIFIECLDCPEELNVNGNGEIILKKRENNFIELEIQSDSIQWLVFSENYLPGWRAYLDDKETKIYRVNSVYIGVLVPDGEHRILFKYNPYLSL
ncbi:MAG: YfhO family protein [Patescibacteria group bacterium]